jgi:hypothetical protein
MPVYDAGRAGSSTLRQDSQTTRRRHYSAEAWAMLRAAIDREHRSVGLVDPRSPRVCPTLGSLLADGRVA